MLTRLFLSLTATLLVLGLAPSRARAQGSDAEAELAGTKFLVEQKGLATGKAPAEQWFAVYAGPCWTSAGSISVTDNDKDQGGLRRIDLAKITSRQATNPSREYESWWIDASGAVVRGERRVFEEHAEKDKPNQSAKYEFKDGKIKVTYTTQEEGGEPKTEKPEDIDVPASFVPDHLIVIVLLPLSDKVQSWKFRTFGGDDYLPFTVTDQGVVKVKGRSGEVDAHKLVVEDKEGEVTYWVDADKRIVAQRWKSLPNILGIAGNPEESRQDWVSRPSDDADAAADKALAGALSLEKQAGDLVYGIYDSNGKVKQTFTGSFKKEDPKYHYLGTTSEVADVGTGSTVEDWLVGADGAAISGWITRNPGGEKKTSTAKIEGGKIHVHSAEAEHGDEDVTLPLLPRLVAPDALFVIRALAKSDAGAGAAFRFSGLDISGELPFSLWIELVGTEKAKLRAGEVDCKHFHILQNTAEAQCWVDAQGNFVMKWSDGDQNVSGTPDEVKKDLTAKLGGASAKKDAGDDE